MGWANCGTDSKGRPIGYAHQATCDQPGCDAQIHHGLDYACGGMHGYTPPGSCEGYFCPKHLYVVEQLYTGTDIPPPRCIAVCGPCRDAGYRDGLWVDEEKGATR